MSQRIIIKQGPIEMTCPREALVEVSETADGVALNFKGGLSVMKTDPYMPSGTKQLIKNTCDNFPTGTITIDLTNYKRPASVQA